VWNSFGHLVLSASELFYTEVSEEWPYGIRLLLEKLGYGTAYDLCVKTKVAKAGLAKF